MSAPSTPEYFRAPAEWGPKDGKGFETAPGEHGKHGHGPYEPVLSSYASFSGIALRWRLPRTRQLASRQWLPTTVRTFTASSSSGITMCWYTIARPPRSRRSGETLIRNAAAAL